MGKNFFDLDAFEDEEVIQEGTETGSMDFDFDDDKESTEDETSSDNVDSSADAESEVAKYDKEYVDRISKYQFKDELEELEIAIGAKLPKDFAEGVSMFDDNNFSGAQIKIDDKVAFVVNEMWPLNRITTARKQDNQYIDNEKLFAIGDDGFGNFIVMNSTDWTYHIWYHDSKKTVMIAKAFDEEGVDPSYNISPEDTLLYKLGYKFPEEADKTDEPPHEGEETVESIEGTDEVTTEEEPDGSTETTEEITATEEPVEEPAADASAGEAPAEEDEKPTQESFVQEDGEETSDEQTVGEAIEAENKTADTGSISTSGDFDDYADNDSTGDTLETSVTPEGDALKDFGTDTSDVQNEYDPKEIEILNKLIAAEAEAINDYFDASKDSHDSNARRLYSDIGHEERFHLEQLMFQKSQFTGEKYEPRDPEVKKEYEELLQLGMDDQTAASTAIDKVAIGSDSDGDFEMDIDILEHAVSNTLTLLRQNQILLEAANYMYDKRAYNNIIEPYGVILEQYYQEEVMNDGVPPKGKRSPMDTLIQAIKTIIEAVKDLARNIREKLKKSNAQFKTNKLALKEPGVLEKVFANDINLYFYNEADKAVNMVIPVQYVDLLYRLSVDIGKQCGVEITKKAYHGTVRKPIKYNSVQDGIAKIKNLSMAKTKVAVTDKNREALIDEFFGYSDKKVNIKVWNEEAQKAIYESNNVYTKLELFCLVAEQYSEITLAILEVIKGLEGNMNSIYYKNRSKYNECKKNMDIIVKTYSMILNAATSDLKEMLKLDKEAIKITRSRDAGNPLPEGEKDRRTSGSDGNNRSGNKYAKTKK